MSIVLLSMPNAKLLYLRICNIATLQHIPKNMYINSLFSCSQHVLNLNFFHNLVNYINRLYFELDVVSVTLVNTFNLVTMNCNKYAVAENGNSIY